MNLKSYIINKSDEKISLICIIILNLILKEIFKCINLILNL